MNKTIFTMLVALLVCGTQIQAQEYTKVVKKAKRSLSNYYLDQQNKGSELDEALKLINEAFQDPAAENDYVANYNRGKIMAEKIAQESAKAIVDPSYKPNTGEMNFQAYKSLKQSFDLSEKSYQKKEVLETMAFQAVNLSNQGISYFQSQDFENAYKALNASLQVKSMLDANKMTESYLPKIEDYNNQRYYTALAAQLAGKNDEATSLYNALIENGYNTSNVYEGLYRVNADVDGAKALSYLEEGRKLYPDSLNLLYVEINHYLKGGEIESLEGKLKQGIEKEPSNTSLHVTLGNVYDRLYQKENEAGNTEKANSYFDSAVMKYEDALKLDNKQSDAMYSIGALYFNKAAGVSKQLKELESDWSKAGIAKYEKKNAELDGLFDKALPWFKKAESINPNDINTLIALKQIFAKKEKVELSNEFKSRLEDVRAGKKLASYFDGK